MASRRALQIGAAVVVAALGIHFAARLPAVHGVRVNDFPAYWATGKMVVSGHPERIYSTQWKWYTNLPVVSLLLAPLGALEYDTAWELVWWLSVASFAAVFGLLLYALARYYPPLTPVQVAVVALVFFSFGPVMRRCLSLGQTTPLMLLLFAFVYLLARAGRDRWAGVLLGFICLIKIPPLLLLPLLALRRRFELAVVASAVVAVGVLASFAFFGTDLMSQYADRVIWDNFGRAHAAFNNQGLDGAWMRILSDRPLTDWVPVERPVALRWAVYGSVAALAGLLLAFGRKLLLPARVPPDADPVAGSLELELALGVALMCLVFPVVWVHYYLFLVVPLCLLPAWWQQRAFEAPPGVRATVVALFVLGVALVGGQEVQENAWYAERDGSTWLRWTLNARPLGALFLVAAMLWPLGRIAERQQAARTTEVSVCGS